MNQQRLEGYRQALKDYGLTAYKELQILLDISSSNYDGARCATEKLIQSGILFDGVFATNDWRAYGVVVALTENHIRVPEDVKVIGFDDIPISNPISSDYNQSTSFKRVLYPLHAAPTILQNCNRTSIHFSMHPFSAQIGYLKSLYIFPNRESPQHVRPSGGIFRYSLLSLKNDKQF